MADKDDGSKLSDLEQCPCKYPFLPGTPGVETLKNCTSMLRNATENILTPEADVEDLFMYGATGGDGHCLAHLANFLSQQYGDRVNSQELMFTAGATQGLHMILTLLCGQDRTIFVEDPSYFYAFRMIRSDLNYNTVPVPMDNEGMIPTQLERLVAQHIGKPPPVSELRPFAAAIYMLPVFHNPQGQCYSKDRCAQILRLAQRHNLLLIVEDVYNLIWFDESPCAPRRLLSYQREMLATGGPGHVISVGSFSKAFAPGVRLGWLEAPPPLIQIFNNSNYANSGGDFNHVMCKLLSHLVESGALSEHLHCVREVYKRRMSSLVKVLRENLPDGCHFVEPRGGFFLWLHFQEGTDASKFLKFALQHHGVNFLAGVTCSPTESFTNCARLSISVMDEDKIKAGAAVLCQAYREFVCL